MCLYDYCCAMYVIVKITNTINNISNTDLKTLTRCKVEKNTRL